MNATDEEIHTMEEYFKDVEGVSIDAGHYAVATSHFHYQIAHASKNDILQSMLEIINWIITSKMADFSAFRKDNTESLYYHKMVFMCIKDHKPNEAAYLMDRHMELLINRVVDYIEYKKQSDPQGSQQEE
jgi:DNA-binding FadR family transcriptional regulator